MSTKLPLLGEYIATAIMTWLDNHGRLFSNLCRTHHYVWFLLLIKIVPESSLYLFITQLWQKSPSPAIQIHDTNILWMIIRFCWYLINVIYDHFYVTCVYTILHYAFQSLYYQHTVSKNSGQVICFTRTNFSKEISQKSSWLGCAARVLERCGSEPTRSGVSPSINLLLFIIYHFFFIIQRVFIFH